MWSTYARVHARTFPDDELADVEDEAYAGSSSREMSAWRVFGWYGERDEEWWWWWCRGMREEMCVFVEDALLSLVVDEGGEWSCMAS